jgi:hypothetical protein
LELTPVFDGTRTAVQVEATVSKDHLADLVVGGKGWFFFLQYFLYTAVAFLFWFVLCVRDKLSVVVVPWESDCKTGTVVTLRFLTLPRLQICSDTSKPTDDHV